MNKISGFQGKYRFLSNFWPATVHYDGDSYPTVEHAYQAAKSLNLAYRGQIKNCPSPGLAKRVSRQATLRAGWDDMKLFIMTDLVTQKFKQHPALAQRLLLTYPDEIEETNTWGDTFWGVCGGRGSNYLGKILMKIREDLVLSS